MNPRKFFKEINMLIHRFDGGQVAVKEGDRQAIIEPPEGSWMVIFTPEDDEGADERYFLVEMLRLILDTYPDSNLGEYLARVLFDVVGEGEEQ